MKREEGGDPAYPKIINQKTATNDQIGTRREREGGGGLVPLSSSIQTKLGRVVWESTHIQKKGHTNVVGKVYFFKRGPEGMFSLDDLCLKEKINCFTLFWRKNVPTFFCPCNRSEATTQRRHATLRTTVREKSRRYDGWTGGGEGGSRGRRKQKTNKKRKAHPSVPCPFIHSIWTRASCIQGSQSHQKQTREPPPPPKKNNNKWKFWIFLYSYSHRIAGNFFLNKLNSPNKPGYTSTIRNGTKISKEVGGIRKKDKFQPKVWLKRINMCYSCKNNDRSGNAKLVSLVRVRPSSSQNQT